MDEGYDYLEWLYDKWVCDIYSVLSYIISNGK